MLTMKHPMILFILFCLSACFEQERPVDVEVSIYDETYISAGNDQELKFPNDTIELEAEASIGDPEAEYLWEKVSGGEAKLQNQRSLTLVVSDLRPGTYIFRVRRTDLEAAVYDEVKVTVHPPIKSHLSRLLPNSRRISWVN